MFQGLLRFEGFQVPRAQEVPRIPEVSEAPAVTRVKWVQEVSEVLGFQKFQDSSGSVVPEF